MMHLSETAEKAITAYGGKELWKSAERIEAEVSVSGLAFILKWRPFFRRAKIVQSVHRPASRLLPIGRRPGMAGVLDHGDVRLEDEDGRRIAERRGARDYFTVGRRLLWWDDLDMAYFANYAFWNYFTLPALLMNESIAWREPAPGRLEAVFPDSLPTHSREQEFIFDMVSGRLIRHDYTADIISPLAKAANVVKAHANNEAGVLFPSERLVTPRKFDGTPSAFPILIQIHVHEYRLMS